MIPGYSALMLPLLRLAADGSTHRIKDAINTLADYMGLQDDERQLLMLDQTQSRFAYRVHTANTYLKKAGLLESAGYGKFCITQAGIELLKRNPLHIDRATLMNYPQFVEFTTRTRPDYAEFGGSYADDIELSFNEQTPLEMMDMLYQGVIKELQDDLLDMVLSASPAFFEHLVIKLLLAMGYGQGIKDPAQIVGRSGDGGIDGIIKQDKLGLDKIYLQAKRWERNQRVGRPVIQGFVGSLTGVGAKKGVLITTATFTQEAQDYAASMQNHTVILIDGEALGRLMIEHGVGIRSQQTYTIYTVNREFFEDNEN